MCALGFRVLGLEVREFLQDAILGSGLRDYNYEVPFRASALGGGGGGGN